MYIHMVRLIYEISYEPNNRTDQSATMHEAPRDPHFTPPLHETLPGNGPEVFFHVYVYTYAIGTSANVTITVSIIAISQIGLA